MKNNVVEFPKKKMSFMPESIDELILRAMNTIDFEPIYKSASGDEWEFDDYECYLDDDGEVIVGHLVYENEEFYQEGLDGVMEVTKQIFLTPESKCIVYYTTHESNFCNCCDEVHCRLSRIYSKDQSLSPNETEDALYQLLLEMNQVIE